MNATREAKSPAVACRVQVTVRPEDEIRYREGCEYAAWYTLWKVLPGTYEVKRGVGHDWPHHPVYAALADAEVVEDYYASHFGGVPVGKYDTKKNAGKRGRVSLVFTPPDLLKHEAVTIHEDDYEAVLEYGLARAKYDAELSFSCCATREDKSKLSGTLEWVGGHAERFARNARLYEEFYFTKARREHNRKEAGRGRDGWKSWNDTHAKKDSRAWAPANGWEYHAGL